jgi:hypothetical protein
MSFLSGLYTSLVNQGFAKAHQTIHRLDVNVFNIAIRGIAAVANGSVLVLKADSAIIYF